MRNDWNNLFLEKKFAEISEIKDVEKNNENVLRVYRSHAGQTRDKDRFTFQIRTYKGIGNYGKGKPRNMMANIELTIPEMEAILEYMKNGGK
jgi:hypothetical protein